MPVNSPKSEVHAPPLWLAAAPQPRPHMTAEFKGLGSSSDGRVSVGFHDKAGVYFVNENSITHKFLQEINQQSRVPYNEVWLEVELEGPRSTCPTNIVSASKVPQPPSLDDEFMAALQAEYPSY